MIQTMPNQGEEQTRSQKKIISKKYYFDLIVSFCLDFKL